MYLSLSPSAVKWTKVTWYHYMKDIICPNNKIDAIMLKANKMLLINVNWIGTKIKLKIFLLGMIKDLFLKLTLRLNILLALLIIFEGTSIYWKISFQNIYKSH